MSRNMLKRLESDDYTVGWYCPLARPEMQASLFMFDEEHQRIPLPENPTFLYAYGEINGHNVVMATAPATEMGITPAAQVTSEMRTLHRRLKFCLLVGVGGAVPRPESRDVRLGDVVVGVPDREAQHGGVIQYDFGKANQNGVFQRTGALNRSHDTLLNAVSMIQSRALSYTPFYEYLNLHLSRNDTNEEANFKRPAEDVLYKATYHHRPASGRARRWRWTSSITSTTTGSDVRQESCEEVGCDRAHAVYRRPRNSERPIVHYGTIASGNKVVKDSNLREQLSGEDGNILCFEMEAAGIDRSLQCLVVRGMCDYCDSHKNKKWQPYAAAAAAAFAKTILEQIPTQQVKRMRDMREVTRVNNVTPTGQPMGLQSQWMERLNVQTPVIASSSSLQSNDDGTISEVDEKISAAIAKFQQYDAKEASRYYHEAHKLLQSLPIRDQARTSRLVTVILGMARCRLQKAALARNKGPERISKYLGDVKHYISQASEVEGMDSFAQHCVGLFNLMHEIYTRDLLSHNFNTSAINDFSGRLRAIHTEFDGFTQTGYQPAKQRYQEWITKKITQLESRRT